MKKVASLFITILFWIPASFSQTKKPIAITAYYAGSATRLDSFPINKLTHIIFSFCHLSGNKLSVSNANDSICIAHMVALKEENPFLKVILSLGGWGGCKDCSAVFSTEEGRNEFSASVKELTDYFQTDGIDLDWEYPAIEGFPGHTYSPDDKKNFTALIRALRKALGKKAEISFAAGGFDRFINESIEWKEVMRMADKINLMSYDLVHGASHVSGHHTPLYSTPQQSLSADSAIKKLRSMGVPSNKIVIGAAFYARMFQLTDTANHGLYDSCSFYRGISYARLYDTVNSSNGFRQYWDETANASYAFNSDRKILVTYDDSASITRKTQYAIRNKLAGIMFWQLADDKFDRGLLDVIWDTRQRAGTKSK